MARFTMILTIAGDTDSDSVEVSAEFKPSISDKTPNCGARRVAIAVLDALANITGQTLAGRKPTKKQEG